MQSVMCFCVAPQEDEMLGGPPCTVLSNNHNFHLTGKWYDEKCSEGGYGFICQKPQGSSSFPFFALLSLSPVGHCTQAVVKIPQLDSKGLMYQRFARGKTDKNIVRHAANE